MSSKPKFINYTFPEVTISGWGSESLIGKTFEVEDISPNFIIHKSFNGGERLTLTHKYSGGRVTGSRFKKDKSAMRAVARGLEETEIPWQSSVEDIYAASRKSIWRLWVIGLMRGLD